MPKTPVVQCAYCQETAIVECDYCHKPLCPLHAKEPDLNGFCYEDQHQHPTTKPLCIHGCYALLPALEIENLVAIHLQQTPECWTLKNIHPDQQVEAVLRKYFCNLWSWQDNKSCYLCARSTEIDSRILTFQTRLKERQSQPPG